ncbi:ornithine cyclodeaminase [Bacillus sp. FJAT-22058]|nr:ornithine cyclodeaminase [Bacillus sp. FJAT-22058]
MFNGKTIFIAGHARLPQGMAAKSVFETLTITAEVDAKYGVVLEASCTLVTEHGREFIERLLKGISLNDGVDEAIESITSYYRGKAANALIAALKDLDLHFQQIKAAEKTKLPS